MPAIQRVRQPAEGEPDVDVTAEDFFRAVLRSARFYVGGSMRRTLGWMTVAIVSVLVLAVAGCSDDDGGDTETGAEAPTSAVDDTATDGTAGDDAEPATDGA